ncbi:hypothetical protein H4S03_005923 [Coemansia sp. S3946]|nr:hypothetical protein H4S03_005923 [Coemansia sp. S3946]
MSNILDRLSLKLDNKGSVARDHLVGVAIRQLYRVAVDLNHGNDSTSSSIGASVEGSSHSDPLAGKVLGASFVSLGMAFVFIGLYRYFHSQYLMTKGKFPVSRLMVGACAVATLALLVGLLVSMFNEEHYEDISETNENAEAREEEDINEFLKYLKDESQRVSTEQSAVYFQLRAEAESAELGLHNEGMWKRLLDVDWDSTLKSVTTGSTLQELLDTDHEFEPDVEVREGEDPTLEGTSTIQPAQVRGITRQLNVVELAPNAKLPALNRAGTAPPLAAKKQSNAKGAQPIDDLEAFLDDLL